MYSGKYLETVYEEIREYNDGKCEDGKVYYLIDWLNEQLEINYIYDSYKRFAGVKIYITLGGPTCWLDTRDCRLYYSYGNEFEQMCLYNDIC